MREQTVTLMIPLRAAWEWVEAGSRETITKPLTTSGKEGFRAWTRWEHHSEKGTHLRLGVGRNHQATTLMVLLMVFVMGESGSFKEETVKSEA